MVIVEGGVPSVTRDEGYLSRGQLSCVLIS